MYPIRFELAHLSTSLVGWASLHTKINSRSPSKAPFVIRDGLKALFR
jgi:hypothetical protein